MKININRFFDDGQLVMLVYIFFYVFILILLSIALGYDRAFLVLDVPVMSPAFSDLHVIVAGYESLVNGYDPYSHSEFDPWGRLYNYPRWWLGLGYLGLSHVNLFFIGCLMVFAYFISAFKLLKGMTKGEGLYCAFVIVSPSSMLAAERGNVDILIFIILAFTVFLYSSSKYNVKLKTSILITAVSILKLYPIFAICVFLKEKKADFYKVFGVVFVLFLLYLFLSWDDLLDISNNTPYGVIRMYGSAVLPMRVFSDFLGMNHDLRPYYHMIGLLIGNGILFFIALFCFLKLKRGRVRFNLELFTERHLLVSFRLGVGIFVGTFALGNNWDYRLIFLIFAIPQLLFWYKNCPEIKRMIFIALTSILILMQWNFISNETFIRIMLLNELTSWILVGILVYLFILSLPEWFKNKLTLP